jgi:hypothetical protein
MLGKIQSSAGSGKGWRRPLSVRCPVISFRGRPARCSLPTGLASCGRPNHQPSEPPRQREESMSRLKKLIGEIHHRSLWQVLLAKYE